MQDNASTIILNRINGRTRIQSLYVLFYACFKQLIDFIISLLSLVILVPIIVIVKMVNLHFEDYGPIFFVQERIGKNGKKFKIIKFRSMSIDADEKLEKMLQQKEFKEKWDDVQKIENDPRITKVGKFLRKTSLDELPQFINVLRGEMSIIGPRPLVPGELKKHKGEPEIYESVKPGITGWWGSHGRSCTTYKARLGSK